MPQNPLVRDLPQLEGMTQLGLGGERTSQYLHSLASDSNLQPALAQLERAVALVPRHQHKRVLGPLFGATCLGVLPFSTTLNRGAFELRAQLHWNPVSKAQGQPYVTPVIPTRRGDSPAFLQDDGATVVVVP